LHATRSATVPHRRISVLIIDDEPAILDLAYETLRDEGYRAVTIASHGAALQHLTAFRFGLILADSPGALEADPWPTLEAVKAAAGDTPVIIFSAHRADRFAGYAERGFAGIISKPFDLDELLATVEKVLGDRARMGSPGDAEARDG
jgi:DNA-binding NtrC family response regulator